MKIWSENTDPYRDAFVDLVSMFVVTTLVRRDLNKMLLGKFLNYPMINDMLFDYEHYCMNLNILPRNVLAHSSTKLETTNQKAPKNFDRNF